jgi:hypothetical protein
MAIFGVGERLASGNLESKTRGLLSYLRRSRSSQSLETISFSAQPALGMLPPLLTKALYSLGDLTFMDSLVLEILKLGTLLKSFNTLQVETSSSQFSR